nr:sulfatase-like hydrolase/transferase [Acidobacteriota bacterium]
VLHAAGYRTAAFLSNMCEANHQGWDSFRCSGGSDGKTVSRALDWARTDGSAGTDGAAGAAGATGGNGRPFLLWVHLFGCHGPYYNGGDVARQLDPGYDGLLGPKKWRLDQVMTRHLKLTDGDLRHLYALYDAAVMGSDRLAGALFDGLRQARRLDHTLFVLAADHGEELYAHNGYLYHSCSVYQTALHVPLGFAGPGLLPAGPRVPQAVELLDVTPTILDLLGVAPPDRLDGRSLVPYFERPDSGGTGKPAFSEYGATALHTVVDGAWKLVHNPGGVDPDCIPGLPPHHQFPIAKAELYDLANDPGETHDLAAREPARVAELGRLISRRFANRTHHAPQTISKELKKKLGTLGYVDH